MYVVVIFLQNETYKACQTVMTCFQDAEDEIDKCLGILIGEKSATAPGATEPPKKPAPPANPDDCMTPVKEKIKQKKVLDRERLQEFKICLNQRIDIGAEDVDPRKVNCFATFCIHVYKHLYKRKKSFQYRYCSTVTGRYQNKTNESSARVKRQVLPELPPQSSLVPQPNSTEPSSSIIPPHSSSVKSNAASSNLPSLSSQEPKNATSGGGVDPFPTLPNATHIASSSLPPISNEPNLSKQSVSTVLGAVAPSSSSASEISTQELTGSTRAESGQPKLEISTPPQVEGLPAEAIPSKISGPSNSSTPLSSPSSIPHSSSGLNYSNSEITTKRISSSTTAEIEYEESGVSGGSSSEVGIPPKNTVLETLARQNISEPLGPPLENSTGANPAESTVHPFSSTTAIHPPASAPGGRPPGSKQNGAKPPRPLPAQDIDASGSDQESQQRVKLEVLREARRRLSEFKGCMARARIKREECKPLVRCCPDTAV